MCVAAMMAARSALPATMATVSSAGLPSGATAVGEGVVAGGRLLQGVGDERVVQAHVLVGTARVGVSAAGGGPSRSHMVVVARRPAGRGASAARVGAARDGGVQTEEPGDPAAG